MVPKVAGKGRSFKGAGLYYLHDKNASTTERVAFTHTENLPTRDPDKAIKCMAWTALRQSELKSRAGGSTKGRKLTQPVYCYSLSWAPGEEPTRDDMIRAAKDTLKALGLDGHEALLVGHNDEPHPHIHVIVNRVHPETGIAAKLSNDHLNLSVWAQGYEEQQGTIRCIQRVENNELRSIGRFIKDRDSLTAAEFRRWREERTARQTDKRALESAVLEDRHDREYDKLCEHRDRQIEGKRKQVQEATRGVWRRLYRAQYAQRRDLEKAQRSFWGRLRFFVRTHGEEFRAAGRTARKQMLKGAFAALIGSKRQFIELERKQLRERRQQGRKIDMLVKNLTRTIREKHEQDVAAMNRRQAIERKELGAKQAQEKKAQAEERKSGRDKRVFQKERDEKRRREVHEQKIDITKAPERAPDTSLRTKFRAAKGQAPRQQSQEQQARKPGKLAEAFREAHEAAEPGKDAQFKDNAQDIGRERGARPREPKPSGFKK